MGVNIVWREQAYNRPGYTARPEQDDKVRGWMLDVSLLDKSRFHPERGRWAATAYVYDKGGRETHGLGRYYLVEDAQAACQRWLVEYLAEQEE